MRNPVIFAGDSGVRQCAFTFDDGPDSIRLEEWLDALEEEGARGTFFFTGEWLDRHPEKARLLLARGHELAPHTYHHRRMSEVPREVFFEEIRQTELAFQDATGNPCPSFMRFPYRAYSEQNLEWLAQWGYVDVEGEDSGDWAGIPAGQIVGNLEGNIRPGSILVHHANDTARHTPEAVRRLVRSVKEKGLAPVKVSDMLRTLGIEPASREWMISIEAPAADASFSASDWVLLRDGEQLLQLADEIADWGNPRMIPVDRASFAGASLSSTEYVAARRFAGRSWAYARASVRGEELALTHFGTREAQADALVYLLRWAASTAADAGCRRITAKQDLRRLELLCRQMGWASEIVPG